jgi:hypothetical protein
MTMQLGTGALINLIPEDCATYFKQRDMRHLMGSLHCYYSSPPD